MMWYSNGWGASIADALTTGILMELPDVVEQQINQLAKVDFSVPHTADTVSLFETTVCLSLPHMAQEN